MKKLILPLIITKHYFDNVHYSAKYTAQACNNDISNWRLPMPIQHWNQARSNTLLGNNHPAPMPHSQTKYLSQGHPNILVSWLHVNGVSNNKSDSQQMDTILLANLSNFKIINIHNSTHGLLDMADIFFGKIGVDTSMVYRCRRAIQRELDLGRIVICTAHSEGGLILYNALLGISEEDR